MDNLQAIRNILKMSDKEITAVKTITPKMAEELLKFNTHNRPVSTAYINKLANDMTTNNFDMSESVIGFNKDGILTNGQSRLMACRKANKNFKAIVCTDLEQTVHLDIGKKRDMVQNIQLNGAVDKYINPNKNSIKTVSTIIKVTNNKQASPEEVVAFCKKYGGLIDDCFKHGLFKYGTLAGINIGPVAAGFLAAYINNVDIKVLEHIRDVLTTSIGTSEKDEIIIKLRDKLVTCGYNKNKGMNTRQIYYIMQSAIYAYQSNKKRITLTSDKEYYPV